MTIYSAQCRAARALLDWSQDQLAEAAAISRSTVADFERNVRMPSSANLSAIAEAFDVNGVELLPDEGPRGVGARMKLVELHVVGGPFRGDDKNVRFQVKYRDRPFVVTVSREALEDIGLQGGIIDKDEDAERAAGQMLTKIKSAATRRIVGGAESPIHLRSRDFQ